MSEAVIVAISGLASFLGSYMALRVHVQYIRRDVDNAIERIESLAESIDFIERNYRRNNHV